MARRRWCLTSCGHLFPSQVPEVLASRAKVSLAREVGVPVMCLSCGRPALSAGFRWREPDGLEDVRAWARIGGYDAPGLQARLSEEVAGV